MLQEEDEQTQGSAVFAWKEPLCLQVAFSPGCRTVTQWPMGHVLPREKLLLGAWLSVTQEQRKPLTWDKKGIVPDKMLLLTTKSELLGNQGDCFPLLNPKAPIFSPEVVYCMWCLSCLFLRSYLSHVLEVPAFRLIKWIFYLK